MQELRHLAIIMDGNGRWAQNRGKSRTAGHSEGAKVVREITQYCAAKNIKYLTLYAFSTENWLRPAVEVDFLMGLLEKYLKSELKTYEQNNIKFRTIGDVSALSKKLQKLIFKMQDATAQNTGLVQNLALNYGSKNEIARAIATLYERDVLKHAQTLGDEKSDYISKNLENALDTKEASSVDLLVRTGGEQRLSNFLLWQCAYAELFFTPTLWPDFKTSELENIISDFHRRTRRFGGI